MSWFWEKARQIVAIATFLGAIFYFLMVFGALGKMAYDYFGLKADVINAITGIVNIIVMGVLAYLAYKATSQASRVQEEVHKSNERETKVNRAAMLWSFKEHTIHIRGNLIMLYVGCELRTVPMRKNENSPITFDNDLFLRSLEVYLDSCDRWIKEYSFYRENGFIIKYLLQHYEKIENINHDIMVPYKKIKKIYDGYVKGTDPTEIKRLILITADYLPPNLQNILPIEATSHYAENKWNTEIDELIKYWDAEWWRIEETFPK